MFPLDYLYFIFISKFPTFNTTLSTADLSIFSIMQKGLEHIQQITVCGYISAKIYIKNTLTFECGPFVLNKSDSHGFSSLTCSVF